MKFYRYVIKNAEHTPLVSLLEFDLLRETPSGYWIVPDWMYRHDDWKEQHKKWINKRSRARFAYPTKEEAMVNFIKRTERRVMFLKHDLTRCERALRSVVDEFACDSCKHYPCPSKVKVKKDECGDYDQKVVLNLK